jgi:exopolysaccharide biosynthesis polyprenyl glycosylphosphotransferase
MPAVRKRRRSREALRRALAHTSPVVWAMLDCLLIGLATYAAYAAMVFENPAYKWVVSAWGSGLAFCSFAVLGGVVFGLYERRTLLARSRILVRSTLAVSLGVVLSYAVISLLFYAEATRWLGVWVVLVYLATSLPLRIAAQRVITANRTRVLFVGEGPSIRELFALLNGEHKKHYEVVGYIRRQTPSSGEVIPARRSSVERFTAADDAGAGAAAFADLCPPLGTTAALSELAHIHDIDEIVVDAELTADQSVGEAVMGCLDPHCRLTDQLTFVETLLGEVPVSDLTPHWFMLADLRHVGSYPFFKRLIDLTAALAGLAITLPLWPLIMIAIRLESRGGAIYRQRRIGANGHEFDILKFRTMRSDAERDGARWATLHDARVTQLGRLLRKTRLDELPQLWNILKGEMSLIGPRPERPEFVRQLAERIPHYRLRHLIKPGLSGWAQIHYGYGGSVADAHRKLCYDLYYLKHRSLELDVAILIRTLGTFLIGSR